MTFLEKAKEDGYVINEFNLMHSCCPYQLGFEKETCNGNKTNEQCEMCWNREMPDTEPKEDVTFIDNLLNQGYNKGLNDAWELAKKLVHFKHEGGFSDKEIQTIFDCDEWQCVFDAFTSQEAIAKLNAYEDSKIEVGDVVVLDDEEYVVTRVNKTPPTITISGLNAKGEAICWSDNDYTKTGKHIDISSILEQIGE